MVDSGHSAHRNSISSLLRLGTAVEGKRSFGAQPTPVFLPGKSQGQRTWRAPVHGLVESDTTEHACAHAHVYNI